MMTASLCYTTENGAPAQIAVISLGGRFVLGGEMDFLEAWEKQGYRVEDGRIIRDEFIRNPETAMKKWQTLRSQCGCDHCDECGNNGCGMIFIDGWEFEDVAQGYVGAVSVRRDGPTCYKKDAERREQAEREEYTQMKADIEDGTHMFKACIRAALDLMPDGCSPDVYGDIVRSAAAVCCHNSSEEK